jgi:hypothetical protein
MELLKDTIPGAARVAVLYDPANQGNLFQVKEILPAVSSRLASSASPAWRKPSKGESGR